MILDSHMSTFTTNLANLQLQEERVDEADLALFTLGQQGALVLAHFLLTLAAAGRRNQLQWSVLDLCSTWGTPEVCGVRKTATFWIHTNHELRSCLWFFKKYEKIVPFSDYFTCVSLILHKTVNQILEVDPEQSD